MQFSLGLRNYPSTRITVEVNSLEDLKVTIHGLVDKWIEGVNESGDLMAVRCADVDRIWTLQDE